MCNARCFSKVLTCIQCKLANCVWKSINSTCSRKIAATTTTNKHSFNQLLLLFLLLLLLCLLNLYARSGCSRIWALGICFFFFSKSFFEYTQTRQMSVELLQIGIPSSSCFILLLCFLYVSLSCLDVQIMCKHLLLLKIFKPIWTWANLLAGPTQKSACLVC